jgi:hypothetical protein
MASARLAGRIDPDDTGEEEGEAAAEAEGADCSLLRSNVTDEDDDDEAAVDDAAEAGVTASSIAIRTSFSCASSASPRARSPRFISEISERGLPQFKHYRTL